MSLSDLTEESVHGAFKELRALSIEEREKYRTQSGFGPAKRFFVKDPITNEFYDSKFVAGLAHRHLVGGGEWLRAGNFYGGKQTISILRDKLQFTILDIGTEKDDSEHSSPGRIRDELILALDVYIRHKGNIPAKNSKEVIELSRQLNALAKILGRRGTETLRNANGVYMTIAHFVHLDPAKRALGKVGIPRGGAAQKAVWDEFASNPDKLQKVAALIRATISLPSEDQPAPVDDEVGTEAAEGRLVTRLHRTRERNRKIVLDRKARELRETGRLECQVCEFNFAEQYGERGYGFIEAHHTMPVHEMTSTSKTKSEDLALLCANCHRMIHAARPWLTIEQLKRVLKVQTVVEAR